MTFAYLAPSPEQLLRVSSQAVEKAIVVLVFERVGYMMEDARQKQGATRIPHRSQCGEYDAGEASDTGDQESGRRSDASLQFAFRGTLREAWRPNLRTIPAFLQQPAIARSSDPCFSTRCSPRKVLTHSTVLRNLGYVIGIGIIRQPEI